MLLAFFSILPATYFSSSFQAFSYHMVLQKLVTVKDGSTLSCTGRRDIGRRVSRQQGFVVSSGNKGTGIVAKCQGLFQRPPFGHSSNNEAPRPPRQRQAEGVKILHTKICTGATSVHVHNVEAEGQT